MNLLEVLPRAARLAMALLVDALALGALRYTQLRARQSLGHATWPGASTGTAAPFHAAFRLIDQAADQVTSETREVHVTSPLPAVQEILSESLKDEQ